MRSNRRFFITCLIVMMFLIIGALVPGITAKRGDNRSRGHQQARNRSYRESLIERFERSVSAEASEGSSEEEGNDPDLPGFLSGNVDEASLILRRAEQTARMRGYDPEQPTNDIAAARNLALEVRRQQEESAWGTANKASGSVTATVVPSTWTQVGPTPIPNGQTQTTSVPVSGRVTCIDVHPTNPLIAYVGTAQGGLFRTADGGATWTNIMAGTPASSNPPAPGAGFSPAGTLAIGAVTIDPVTPSTVFVGTGEGNLSLDSFFGEGIYRIINADTTPTIQGPFETRTNGGGGHAFAGTAINKIIIDPNNNNNMFVGNTLGGSGLNGENFCCGNVTPISGFVGLYFSANAQAATPTWVRVNPASLPGGGVAGVSDIAIDPTNANILVLNQLDFGGGTLPNSGVFRSTNALSGASATYTKVINFSGTQTNGKFAAYKQGAANTVFYLASGESNGRLRVSTDAGATWSAVLTAANGFCGGQCFYDIAVAADPGATTAQTDDIVYLAGNVQGASTKLVDRSDDGGTTFAHIDNTLHADSHALRIAPSDSNKLYTGNDGGVWRSDNAKAAAASVTWFDANTATFIATQYVGMDVHPVSANFTLGGTQDNGTHVRDSAGVWNRADFGDGGYAVIDQNSTTDATTIMYHTYFNQANNLVGYARQTNGSLATEGTWSFFGCQGTTPANGITCGDSVNFYAPLQRGPNAADTMSPTPHNPIYYGTDRLYRSADMGVTNVVVSQAPITASVPISAIGVAPTNDNVRIVGQNNGGLWYTTTGSSTLTNLDPTNLIPNKFIGRIVFDPTNANTAYITLDGYTGLSNHVWKVINLSTSPTIVAASGGFTSATSALPDVPVNAFAIDPSPLRNFRLFAGTDIGVYISENGGLDWYPFGAGLPRVAVFALGIQPTSRTLRAATHGLGVYEITIPLPGPTAASTAIRGSVVSASGSPLGGVSMTLSTSNGTKVALTDSGGAYSFVNLAPGEFYTVSPTFANYSFSPTVRSYSLNHEITDATFVAQPNLLQTVNPVDETAYFVRQQYLDFLGREPDAGGLAYWSSQLAACGSNAECQHQRRIDISAAYFFSEEFQQTGSYVYRLYKASYGRMPNFAEFTSDRGRVVDGSNLDQRKQALADDWVSRASFRAVYPDALSASEFVNRLYDSLGVAVSSAERQQQIDAMQSGKTRAQVLREAIEVQAFKEREYNPSFVLMQYFGYLRRDIDTGGFQFWLDVLNNRVPGNFRSMVCAFLTSAEYQHRFSAVVSRSNSECGS